MADSTCVLHLPYHPDKTQESDSKGKMMLGESISFGRFATDPSVSWEKWSAFSHNRYLDEVEKFSKPGSVAQKKAYFEAHYKRIAAKKAASLLEQAQSVESNTQAEKSNAVAESEELGISTDENACENLSRWNEVSVLEESKVPANEPACENHSQCNGVSESQKFEVLSTNESQSQCDEVSELEDFDAPANANACENQSQNVEFTAIPEPTDLDGCFHGDMMDKAEVFGEEVALGNEITSYLAPVKEEEGIVEEKLIISDGQAHVEDLVQLRDDGTRKPDARIEPGRSDQIDKSPLKENCSANRENFAGKDKNLVQTPLPRDAQIMRKLKLHHASPAKPAPFNNKKENRCKSKSERDSKQSSQGKRSVQNSLHMSLSLAPGNSLRTLEKIHQSEVSNSGRVANSSPVTKNSNLETGRTLLSTPPTGIRRSFVSTPSSSFSLRSDERAAKRREFFLRLEERSNAKEAQKAQLQEKTKKEVDLELKRLRQSLNFKATTMPDFYGSVTEVAKKQIKKIPLTRPVSPKLGRKLHSKTTLGLESSRPPKPTNTKSGGSKVASKKSPIVEKQTGFK
ncbi:hypothetical protein AMTRI_Chr06g200320 [Amborella trichopoda]|nr:protein WVD2-like 7 isoform X1 [Amborella trichopoda]XP_020527751.1 protein WVD2-like 7 isoform X1 [Amborella trichopoda]XP_020527752.1 protein WVD2-like 7 isoform X1 [Amborella trichopoda]XP_020527753.1 protein WVD2-like 7 isoform X1 [Amborella trichopoda]|eukprot:XP_011626222.1 protein WVD2-like 7 isoform X1 [Amborella trichopoda]